MRWERGGALASLVGVNRGRGWTVNELPSTPWVPGGAAWIGQDRGLAWSLSFSGGSPIAPWSFGHAGFHHDAGVAEVVVAIEL